MVRFRSVPALLLLTALAVGGAVAPVVHGALHANEAVRAEGPTDPHLADGHHHHDPQDDHGLEVLPPCPEPLDAHLTCVLCAPASVTMAAEEAALAPPRPGEAEGHALATRVTSREGKAPGARGPPALA